MPLDTAIGKTVAYAMLSAEFLDAERLRATYAEVLADPRAFYGKEIFVGADPVPARNGWYDCTSYDAVTYLATWTKRAGAGAALPGPAGPAGATGLAGARGAAGAAGEAGPAGNPGATGARGAAGLPGAIGATGAAGTTSQPGTAGAAGVAGAAGPAGPAGVRGAPGAAGSVGAQGVPGLAGTPGAPGAGGATGPAGAAGTASQQGAPGAPGTPGTPGAPGIAGARGSTGAAGAAGMDGARGVDGLRGAAGAVGTTGVAGQPGPPGAAGLRGPAGLNGTAADVGPQGPAGEPGARGIPGPVGSSGPAGSAGPAGSQGPAGEAGASGAASTLPGLSAYQTAVNNGFVGPEAAWLRTLVGPGGAHIIQLGANPAPSDGILGDMAINSSTGDYFEKTGSGWAPRGNIKGPKGDPGAAGPAGPAGPAGAAGAAGSGGTGGTTGTGGHIIQGNGTALAAQPILNFVGDNILVENDGVGGKTRVSWGNKVFLDSVDFYNYTDYPRRYFDACTIREIKRGPNIASVTYKINGGAAVTVNFTNNLADLSAAPIVIAAGDGVMWNIVFTGNVLYGSIQLKVINS